MKLAKRMGWWVIGLGILALLVWWIFNQFPKGPDYSQSFTIQGRDHIAIGSSHPAYNSNPPTSGPHYAQEATIAFYKEELPDEQLVHNLEHGNIWIAYRPGVGDEVVRQLGKFAGGNVIVTARSKNDTDIGFAAWGRLDKFDVRDSKLNTQRIRDFILRYENRGPENPNLPR